MKVISLHQPWTPAMAFGWKKNETRHWVACYRGSLPIHAAKKIINWPTTNIQIALEQSSGMGINFNKRKV